MILNPYRPCDVPRQSGGSAQIPSPASYGPKSVQIKAVDTKAIEPEGLEPGRIELDKNLGTDPCQSQKRFERNSLTEDFGFWVATFRFLISHFGFFAFQFHVSRFGVVTTLEPQDEELFRVSSFKFWGSRFRVRSLNGRPADPPKWRALGPKDRSLMGSGVGPADAQFLLDSTSSGCVFSF